MKNICRLQCIPVLFVILHSILSGCASTDPARFYTLNTVNTTSVVQQETATESGFSIGIGPVEIPDYLNRPQIVIRNDQNRLIIAEFDRWAGSLKEDIIRVLVKNLQILLSQNRTTVLSSLLGVSFDYRVVVDIVHLDVMPDGNVVLKAQWSIIEKDGRTVRLVRESGFTESVQGTDYSRKVAAMSRAIEKLSQDIAETVKSLSERKM